MGFDFVSVVTKAINELGAMQKYLELFDLLRAINSENPRTVVEIGTAKGGTLYALCQVASEDAIIVSIDLPGGAFGGGYTEEDKERFLTYKKPDQNLVFIMENSQFESTRKKLSNVLGRRKIDFLLIDGDHTYEGVKKDWDLYAPMVRKNGLVALHDILIHPQVPFCEVHKFWHEIKGNYDHDVFIDQSNLTWGGIGLIRYNKKKVGKKASDYGLLLHLGTNVQPPKGFIVMAPNGIYPVDIAHDFESFPWPLEDNSVHICLGPHVIEHIKPWLIIQFFDELWRILKPEGQVALSTPYAGSPGYFGDPTHCCGFNERSFSYFTPDYQAYLQHKPKPWNIEKGYPTWRCDGNLEVLMRPRK